jgi:putative transposase
MPRPIRFFIPGNVWHVTHRCHNKEFLLDYAKYRSLWMKWLYEGTSRYDVPVLNFTVTSNHVHLLVLAPEDMEAIPRLMQLVAGRVGQVYNKNRNRKGAFWEKRYNATAVQNGEHLGRCFLYIDLNMVRAKKVKHPRQWEHGGYHEIVEPKQRYRTISRQEVTRLLDVGENELPKTYQGWIKEALRKGNLSRDEIWSSKLAVGDAGFVEQIKKNVGRWVSKMAVNEDLAQYGQHSEITGNSLEWCIFDEKRL